jgi:tetratricopeptide (TPR) repeat protein
VTTVTIRDERQPESRRVRSEPYEIARARPITDGGGRPVTRTTKSSTYDRPKLMKKAAAARSKGKDKKAIALYLQVLDRERDNPELHRKLAPLYVKTRQPPEALASYQVAAEGLVRQGFDDQAIGLLRGAAEQLPREVIVWQSLAELDLKRKRPVDAFETLVEGRGHMRRRSQRLEAIQLLSKARKIDPRSFPVSYDLACLLGKTGRRALALRLLEELARRPDRRQLSRVRRRQLRLSPSPGALGRYVRAALLRR